MAIQGAVRLDNYKGSKDGSNKTVKYASADLQNGSVFNLGGLVSGEREAFTVVKPATASLTTSSIYLHASVEITYLAGQTITDYVLPAGAPGRGVLLQEGDIVTITDAMIESATTVGEYVIPQDASFKLAPAADLTGGTKFAGEVIEKTTLYGQAASVFRVIKN